MLGRAASEEVDQFMVRRFASDLGARQVCEDRAADLEEAECTVHT